MASLPKRIPTADPGVWIEEQSPGYVRYVNKEGRRWEVYGLCDRRGDCLIGAVIEGFGIIESHEDIEKAKKQLGQERIDSELDVPVTPEFEGLCCPFRFIELEPIDYKPPPTPDSWESG